MTEAAAPPAVEPETPVEAAEAHAICANCSTALVGDYCHACGQKAHLQSKLRHLLREFAESIASFDGRVWRTLPLITFRPGVLSRRWREGKRVRYVAPLHFFLFSVFLLFLVPTVTGRHIINIPKDAVITASEASRPGLNASFQVGEIEEPAAPAAGAKREDDGPGVKAGANASFRLGQARDAARARSAADLRAADERVRAEAAARGVDPDTITGPDAALRHVQQRLDKARADGEGFSNRVEDLASRLSFALVPITMVILWLLLLFKRGYSLYDHAVVALYGIGFFALMIAVALALPGRAANWAVLLLLFAAPAHALVHLKGAYALSWPGAVIRAVFLGVFTLATFGIFLVTVVLLGLLA